MEDKEIQNILIVNQIKKALQLNGRDKIKLSKTSTDKYSWEISLAIRDGELLTEWVERVDAANNAMLDSFKNLNKMDKKPNETV